MKKKLFLALLTTLLLLLAASTALAADYSDYTCSSCGNPCDGWYPLSDNNLNYHVPACYSCGIALLDKKEHCTPEDGTATCKTAPRCSVCSIPMSVEYGPDPDAHSMVESWSFTNETQHFRVCQNGCGKTEYADHTGGTATCTQLAVCDVCNSGYGGLSDTNHGEFSDWTPYTATQHYRYCIECSENCEYADHTGGTATCTELAECEVCHKPYGDLSDTNHGAFTEWTSISDTQHYRHCMDCGMNEEYADHSGGTATCTQRAVCDVCHTQYGEFSDTNHGEFSDWMGVNNTQHLRYCTSCAMNEEYADHTGGTATCMEYAVCEVCHAPYGELSDTNHGEFTDWMPYTDDDDTQHYRRCQDCGWNREYASHTGGTATCTKRAVCDVCHGQYGELSDANHGEFTDWIHYDDTQHYRSCIDCRENREYADHTGGTASCESGPICEVCKREYGSSLGGHAWGEWKSNDDGTHTRVCLNDAAHTETKGCSGGKATCTEDGVCKDCGAAYIPARNHNWGDWWSNGDGTHTRECFNDSTHTETGTCSGGEANCSWGAVCDLCGAAYTEPTSTHTGPFSEWTCVGGTGTHSRYCKTCLDEEFGDCTGGTANCVSGPVCTICEGEYGNRDTTAHVGPISEWMSNGAAEHKRTCSACGYYEFEKHSPGTAATCVTGTICAVCNSEYGHVDYNNHIGLPTDWEYNSGRHWKYCQTCQGYVFGYHTGGTATCTEDGVCEVCDAAYIPATGHKWGKGVSNGDGTHTRVCLNDASHTETKDCYGGEATCTEDGVCEVCDAAYIPATNHNYGEWKSNDDGTHTRACLNDAAHTETEDCSGGEATCTEDGVCEVCDAAYIPAIKHAWGAWESNDDGTHTRICLNDATHTETEDCSGGKATCTEDGVCEVCDAAYIPATNHNYGEWKSNDDGTHTRVCANDATHTETDDCSGGTATCTEDGVCEVCDAAYIPAIKHAWGAWESNDDGTHTRACLNDVAHTETEDCSGGKATCTEDGVCEVCDAAYIPAIKHAWGAWESNDDGTHTRVCLNDAAHTETEDCSGGTATCAVPAICEVCGTGHGSVDPDAHDLQLDEAIPATCVIPGLERYLCQNEGCPDPVHETVLPAFGQHLYNHWDILGANQHHTDCAVCGENADVGCTLWGMYDGETLLTVCPVCGDFLDRPFAILIAREDVAVPIGTLLVRGLEAPFEGALYGVTVAGVYGGEVVDIHGTVTITIPVSCEDFTLVRVEIIDGVEYRTEIPFTLEDGHLTFSTDVAGLFLLVPVE